MSNDGPSAKAPVVFFLTPGRLYKKVAPLRQISNDGPSAKAPVVFFCLPLCLEGPFPHGPPGRFFAVHQDTRTVDLARHPDGEEESCHQQQHG